ncbi:MAG TPA: malectin domain-containing carbohydrate-binding protein [Chitinophagaceae bacterium]|nr:malectin domain-containing carbohydrate-binding protein [Chitinophagaceae bacterium]
MLMFLCVLVPSWLIQVHAQQSSRVDISLNKNWKTIASSNDSLLYLGFYKINIDDNNWKQVDIPHNWDAYEGYRRTRHGNRHGDSWYRKTFSIKQPRLNKRFFLFFEGVGSYAYVFLNGEKVGEHIGGRTTFNLDITDFIKTDGSNNYLAVRAYHPSGIKDLPWVCGGCSDERGFSEGSQPMGIFRPVHLIITNDVRIEPFGVHIWNDTTVSIKSAQVYFETDIRNYSKHDRKIIVLSRLVDKKGVTVAEHSFYKTIMSGDAAVIIQHPLEFNHPHLWSLEDPYLYTLVTEIIENEKVIDRVFTPYGIRSISWPVGKSTKQFLLNGKPVFINGIAEYEHLLGSSHAFSDEEIKSRVMQIKAAGFNAFRDAHQPHNLRYQNYWDSLGFLWWPQMSAHIWYDSPEFRDHFKTLLKQWVKERRNSPSLVLWGLQNESKLPEDFAKECTAIIRALDPTASSQRLIVTCNGGSGTDWDVPQNWTGTYGGDPTTYDEDLKRQVLVGEYGAWRTLDLHTENPSFQDPLYSEDRMTQLMETKIRLAEKVKDSTVGHFMWLFSSHDNPGRAQAGEGYRELDRIGPVNYKGLLTPWEQPLDVYYMYRSNFISKEKEPMVYIVSHTWPNRWTTTGEKDGIVVYSNCDEVELFNDVHSISLGKRKKQGVGTHFQWDGVDIRYNVLYAVGYVNGKEVAKDYIFLNHLPQAPRFNEFFKDAKRITAPRNNYNYLYRVNCGGGDYIDENGSLWLADRQINNAQQNNHSSLITHQSLLNWGSVSWTNDFSGMPAFFASQQRISDPIKGTKDWKLFQTFRYGREKLKYIFPVQDGEYLIELYFTEPWLGTGGGMDCTGWRIFDVAVNDKTVLKNVDIWKEVGHDAALKKIIKVKVNGGQLIISFPHVASGQAVISAIAIASLNKKLKSAPSPEPLLKLVNASNNSMNVNWSMQYWLDEGDEQYLNEKTKLSPLPPELFGAEWIKTVTIADSSIGNLPTIELTRNADVFIGVDSFAGQPSWLKDFANTKTIIQNDNGSSYAIYKKRFQKGEKISLNSDAISNKTYLVAAVSASDMEPPYDLKPIVSYKSINGKLRGPGVVKGQIDGKDRVIFQNASTKNSLEWDFAIGVADKYSLTISYNNPHTEIIKGVLQLSAFDGRLMKEEEIQFTPTREGKLNYINTTTGTMINAGNYKLRLTSKDAEGLSINSLDVQ